MREGGLEAHKVCGLGSRGEAVVGVGDAGVKECGEADELEVGDWGWCGGEEDFEVGGVGESGF
jgi:hypothetical protein